MWQEWVVHDMWTLITCKVWESLIGLFHWRLDMNKNSRHKDMAWSWASHCGLRHTDASEMCWHVETGWHAYVGWLAWADWLAHRGQGKTLMWFDMQQGWAGRDSWANFHQKGCFGWLHGTSCKEAPSVAAYGFKYDIRWKICVVGCVGAWIGTLRLKGCEWFSGYRGYITTPTAITGILNSN